MGQKSKFSAVLAALTDGANFKKWGQILKIGAKIADFCGFRHALPIRRRLGAVLFFVKFWRRLWDKKSRLDPPAGIKEKAPRGGLF